jgi:hypothetical protein
MRRKDQTPNKGRALITSLRAESTMKYLRIPRWQVIEQVK